MSGVILYPYFLQRQLNSHSYTVSPDLKFVLISSNKAKVYRHSYTAQYALFSIQSR